MTTPEKKAAVAELRERITASKAFIMADYRGLTVQEINELRRAMRQEGAKFAVVKNTLFSRALEGTDADPMRPLLVGPTAIAFSDSDAVAIAKVLVEFAKEHENLAIKGGFGEGQMYTLDEIKRLAELPSREELLAQLVRNLQGPMADFVFTLRGIMSDFVFTLQAVADKRAQEAA